MKTSIILLFISVSLVLSCSKQATVVPVKKGISYPDSIYFGKNILSLPDSIYLVDSKSYDLGAVLEKDANLSLVISNLSDKSQSYPVWYYNNNTGLIVMEYNSSNNTQKFIASQTGKVNLQIQFETFGHDGTGECKIEFYENSNTITRTKYLKW